jgi:hypothetical protein
MTIRLAHLACIDVLATSVALARGPGIASLIERIKSSLDDQHIAEQPAPTPHSAPETEVPGGTYVAPRSRGQRAKSKQH